MITTMQRIAIIGPGSSGKSTLAITLGKTLDLPIYHLDEYYWQPNHVRPDEASWRTTHRNLIDKEAWIIEGGYSKLIPERLERADTILYLNMSRRTYVAQYFKRLMKYRKQTRPGMANDNPEKFSASYLKMILKFGPDAHLPFVEKYSNDPTKQIVILKNPKSVHAFIASLDSA